MSKILSHLAESPQICFNGSMVILGVDPGTARLGWGIVKDENSHQTVGAYGCLQTLKTKPDAQRLEELFNHFSQLLEKLKPDVVAVEDLFFFKNQKTVIQISQARGVILLAAQKLSLPIFSYSPLQVKMAVAGYGRADKKQVQQMTKAILRLSSIPKPDDTADALAVALTHAFTRKLSSKIKLKP
jgi:crossover junction endodeoxyribonuclease RuvC